MQLPKLAGPSYVKERFLHLIPAMETAHQFVTPAPRLFSLFRTIKGEAAKLNRRRWAYVQLSHLLLPPISLSRLSSCFSSPPFGCHPGAVLYWEEGSCVAIESQQCLHSAFPVAVLLA